MSKFRKLVAVAVFAVAAMALSAGQAFAAPVEITDANGIHCDDITFPTPHDPDGGCEVHVNSVEQGVNEIRLLQHTMMGTIQRSDCVNEYWLHLGEDGEGWLEEISILPHDEDPCTPQPCIEEDTDEQEPWHVQVEHDGEGNEHAIISLCLDIPVNADPLERCEIDGEVEIDLINDDGAYSAEAEDKTLTVHGFTAHPGSGSPTIAHARCEGLIGAGAFEIDGHWTFEDPTGIIINHL